MALGKPLALGLFALALTLATVGYARCVGGLAHLHGRCVAAPQEQ